MKVAKLATVFFPIEDVLHRMHGPAPSVSRMNIVYRESRQTDSVPVKRNAHTWPVRLDPDVDPLLRRVNDWRGLQFFRRQPMHGSVLEHQPR